MTFDVRMGLYKLPKENDEVYSILLSDTILVEDAAEVLTSKCTKKFNDVFSVQAQVLTCDRYLMNWTMIPSL